MEENVYKNPDREDVDEIKPYVPQYKIRGVQPIIEDSLSSSPLSPSQQQNKIPNVGSVQNTLYRQEYEEYNEFEYPVDGKVVDNNDYVNIDNIQMKSNINFPKENKVNPPSNNSINTDVNEEGKYILIWNGEIISISNSENIQEQARMLVFGEHKLSLNKPVKINELTILKKIKIKVGLFLDED